jgi:hypothetical protein
MLRRLIAVLYQQFARLGRHRADGFQVALLILRKARVLLAHGSHVRKALPTIALLPHKSSPGAASATISALALSNVLDPHVGRG